MSQDLTIQQLRYRLSVACSLAAMFAAMLFSFIAWRRGDNFGAMIDAVLFVMFSLGLVSSVWWKRHDVTAAVASVGLSFFVLSVGMTGMIQVFIWPYAAPVVVFFLAGLRLGSIFNAILLLTFAASAIIHPPDRVAVGVEVSLCVSFFLVVIVAFLYERARNAYELKLKELSNTDALTRLPNRRCFDSQLLAEVSRARRMDTGLTLVLVDVDFFKQINDGFGHPEGDRVLRELSALVQSEMREGDTFARLGGDEFALLAPHKAQGQPNRGPGGEAEVLCERLMHAASKIRLPDGEALSLSLGAARLHGTDCAESLLKAADMALYKSKQAGRARYTVRPMSEPLRATPLDQGASQLHAAAAMPPTVAPLQPTQ